MKVHQDTAFCPYNGPRKWMLVVQAKMKLKIEVPSHL